ncbi:pyocin activator PrtN family protein [Providencia sp.]|uniref:pyocin activator PrtN family protein n=1 Tax=Providencia sp. TaxID=589 RepID=UPI003F9B045D
MNTAFLLMAEFGTSQIPLADIAEKYLKMNQTTVERKANAGELPIPTYRLNDSQKSPRMIHVNDLATFIDKQRDDAIIEFNRSK